MSEMPVERHVQAIWFDRALRPAGLRTRRGETVRVVTPGVWNLGAGPDFRDAVLELGDARVRVKGDVEVHLCPADWDFHRHGADPRYRNVIAHVTWGCGPDPESLPPGAVTIWLGRFMAADPAFSVESIDLAAYPYARLPEEARPCERTVGRDPETARRVLAAAGRHRLRMKARRLLGRLCAESDRRQLFYEEVMGALGYARNSAQFRRVARRVPLGELRDGPEAARTAFAAAGSFEEWDRLGCRPNNSPEARLAKAAEVILATPMMRLLDAERFDAAELREQIRAISSPGRCMGRGRAGAVIANVVVPWAIAEGRLADAPEWLPPEDVSEPVRLTAFRLFGRDHNPAAFYACNGLLIQGLLQIFRDDCLKHHPDCSGCRLAAG